MSPFLLHFASGAGFYSGMLMLVAGLLLRLWLRGRVPGALLVIVASLGFLFVVLSATPLSLYAYSLWLVLLVLALVTSGLQQTKTRNLRIRYTSLALAVLMSITLCCMELPYHITPKIPANRQQTVYVVGDSLSAGIGSEERTWPAVLADLSRLNVVNLAKPGATVQSAIHQADRIPDGNALVIVEIGGNDLLGDTSNGIFRDHLDALLAKLGMGNRTISMFEIPLPPFRNRFGGIQRELARKHDVILVPKSCMSGVLGLKDGTLDGLHLSQKGHDALARSVLNMLRVD